MSTLICASGRAESSCNEATLQLNRPEIFRHCSFFLSCPSFRVADAVNNSLVDVALDMYKGLRMVAYRLLRTWSGKNTEYRKLILSLPIDYALTQTFASTVVPDVSTASAGGDGEKAEALKLLRSLLLSTPFLEASKTLDHLVGLLITLAEAIDDPYHVLSLQTLCELGNIY